MSVTPDKEPLTDKVATMKVKTGLRWFSSWRNGDKPPCSRVSEFADIRLVVHEKEHAIVINDELDEGSSWLFKQIGPTQWALAVKMTPPSSQKCMRYYGFTTASEQYYLCQHSVKAETNPEHTLATYMDKFLAGDFKHAQTYHISRCHT